MVNYLNCKTITVRVPRTLPDTQNHSFLVPFFCSPRGLTARRVIPSRARHYFPHSSRFLSLGQTRTINRSDWDIINWFLGHWWNILGIVYPRPRGTEKNWSTRTRNSEAHSSSGSNFHISCGWILMMWMTCRCWRTQTKLGSMDTYVSNIIFPSSSPPPKHFSLQHVMNCSRLNFRL